MDTGTYSQANGACAGEELISYVHGVLAIWQDEPLLQHILADLVRPNREPALQTEIRHGDNLFSRYTR
jgi:hypothetical protein